MEIKFTVPGPKRGARRQVAGIRTYPPEIAQL